jgi:hypothetical protein
MRKFTEADIRDFFHKMVELEVISPEEMERKKERFLKALRDQQEAEPTSHSDRVARTKSKKDRPRE